jgi:hypothetical protein
VGTRDIPPHMKFDGLLHGELDDLKIDHDHVEVPDGPHNLL